MSTAALATLIGQTVCIRTTSPALDVECVIIDARTVYGKPQVCVVPALGARKGVWVDCGRVVGRIVLKTGIIVRDDETLDNRPGPIVRNGAPQSVAELREQGFPQSN